MDAISPAPKRLGRRVLQVVLAAAALCIVAGLLLPRSSAPDKAKQIRCVQNLHKAAAGLLRAAVGNDGRFPPTNHWPDALLSAAASGPAWTSEKLICPADTTSRPLPYTTYAFNRALDGKRLAEVDLLTVMLFESAGGWNVSGGQTEVLLSWHNGTVNVALVDGSVQECTPTRLAKLNWGP